MLLLKGLVCPFLNYLFSVKVQLRKERDDNEEWNQYANATDEFVEFAPS
jgi:hypothetical protein